MLPKTLLTLLTAILLGIGLGQLIVLVVAARWPTFFSKLTPRKRRRATIISVMFLAAAAILFWVTHGAASAAPLF